MKKLLFAFLIMCVNIQIFAASMAEPFTPRAHIADINRLTVTASLRSSLYNNMGIGREVWHMEDFKLLEETSAKTSLALIAHVCDLGVKSSLIAKLEFHEDYKWSIRAINSFLLQYTYSCPKNVYVWLPKEGGAAQSILTERFGFSVNEDALVLIGSPKHIVVPEGMIQLKAQKSDIVRKLIQ